ncbi:MAG: hypothetical protein CSB48_11735 [Proteobacteria bacterium]|nr:MAG: hypothetical protein CSB48_11735 [Pseudomonadota bacterium]
MFNIVYQEKGGRRKRLDFNSEFCAIGSDKRNDFVIKDRKVAKFHAEIRLVNHNNCIVKDLGSKTGTWVNSEKLAGEKLIDGHDEIVIGGTKIWVFIEVGSTFEHEQSDMELANPGTEELVSTYEKSDTPIPEIDDALSKWVRIVHEQLISQMDLRRKDIHKMSDADLRTETEALIDLILRGLKEQIDVDVEVVKMNVLNEAIGLGPLEQFLLDDDISEIMVNNYREVFIEKAGRLAASEYVFSSDQAVLSVIERIITPVGRRIDESSPMVDARLKDGSRINAIIPPLALKGPALTIRKFSKKRLVIDDLVEYGSLNVTMAEFLRVCVESRKNIVVSGGTGTGKTTLLNVLSSFIPDSERIITVEDSAELKLDQPNLITLESKPANLEGKGGISIRDLVKNTLRMRPDRIVVGECRGGEALDMLQAMNTGHDGSLTTIHANTPRDLVSRLEVMVLMSGMDLPIQAIREQIASAVDIIVQQTRYPCGSRKISRITEVVGMESGIIQLQDIFLLLRRINRNWNQTGYWHISKTGGEHR